MKPEYLQRCQVATPHDVVGLLWKIANEARPGSSFHSVLDLGAGDARFARDPLAKFGAYVGVEHDRHKIIRDGLPVGAQVVRGDAMRYTGPAADLCIGNPPYIKSAHLDPDWRARTLARLEKQSGTRLKETANLYVLFLLQALLRTRDDGLVVQLVPYEWVSRPSATELREYLVRRGWDIKVLRFNADIFPDVLTTASVVVIDKRSTSGAWSFGEIGRSGNIQPYAHPSGTAMEVLPYSARHQSAHALRGLSPGGQEIFVLTEEDRRFFSLRKKRDVTACVTSLRRLTPDVQTLDAAAFQCHYVDAGARCWLIRSDRDKRSPELTQYLASVSDHWKKYSTCTAREDWARYSPHPAPALLVSSGFIGQAPKVVVNMVGAVAVGSVYGVLSTAPEKCMDALAKRLRSYDFSQRVVHQANNLKKIEVRQLNAVLERFNI